MAQQQLAVADPVSPPTVETAVRHLGPITRCAPRAAALTIVALLVLSTLSGCATMKRDAYCALAGAGAGAAAGIIYGVNEDNYDALETMGVTVGGAAAGALLGYGVCAIADLAD